MKLSVVVSAYNEEKKLKDCLESVKNIADEIIVVNNTSIDNTEKIAKQYTDKVFLRKNNPMLNINKNFGFSKATGDWILNLDADERLTPELEQEIKSIISQDDPNNGYLIPRKNILFGKWIQHSIWWPDYQLRLFKKGKGKFPEVHVHELLEVEGEVGKIASPMIHLNYETVSQFLYKLEKIYTENEVEQFLKSGKSIHWSDAISMPVHDFLKTYFMQKGYKDGLHGLVLSLLQSFYAEVVFAKIWEKKGFEEKEISIESFQKETRKLGREFNYWVLSSLIEESKGIHNKILLKVKRKVVNKKI